MLALVLMLVLVVAAAGGRVLSVAVACRVMAGKMLAVVAWMEVVSGGIGEGMNDKCNGKEGGDKHDRWDGGCG